ncbi:MAG: hypothetical protein HOG49_21555 [Candidatus Scalindua sp.]|jgi:hypothetical protein|nr:hypothetical protein [Candidatus Scalindua sp.]
MEQKEDTQKNKRYFAWGCFITIISITVVSMSIEVKNLTIAGATVSGCFLVIGAYMGLSTVIDHFSKDKKDK